MRVPPNDVGYLSASNSNESARQPCELTTCTLRYSSSSLIACIQTRSATNAIIHWPRPHIVRATPRRSEKPLITSATYLVTSLFDRVRIRDGSQLIGR